MTTGRRIVIIGAGFSGTATAVRLLRRSEGRAHEVTLIERQPDFGRGVAYARRHHPYILNVPASRMSATTDDANEFLRYAQRHDPHASGDDFLPRAVYGDYLQELLETAASAAEGSVRFRRINGEAVELRTGATDAPVVVTLADGTRIEADAAVLAVGFLAPRLPASIRSSLHPPAIRAVPWAEGKAAADGGPILIIGSGLTMADVACEAVARHPNIRIHAISRHGLIPPSQTQFQPDALRDDHGLLTQAAGSTRRLTAAVRALAGEAERLGGDWREAVTHVRKALPSLWATLAEPERRRFLRHAQSYWDIHRHRLPGAVLARIDQLRASGQLVVHAGRVRSLEAVGEGVRALWVRRGGHAVEALDVAEVVPCTGPDYDITRTNDALWRALVARGLAVPDPLRLGIRTGRHGALVHRDGRVSDQLFYVGPMLRADHWEATAVGELRVHAHALAEHLLGL